MQNNTNTLLLHCCCAPCTLLPLEALLQEERQITLLYSNSNIHPKAEYELRLDTLSSYAKAKGIELCIAAYETDLWDEQVGKEGGPYPCVEGAADFDEMLALRKKRCSACYRLRFKSLAEQAQVKGIPAIASTLSVSPYQFTDLINETLLSCATPYQLQALQRDWRDLYTQATRASRALGMYRQNYCGCHYSKEEAEIERQARKLARTKARAQKAGESLV